MLTSLHQLSLGKSTGHKLLPVAVDIVRITNMTNTPNCDDKVWMVTRWQQLQSGNSKLTTTLIYVNADADAIGDELTTPAVIVSEYWQVDGKCGDV